ncbi:MAG TPA: trypsin-like peptidase domain-containing protein [Oscillatoriaceae cyanobacterium]
MRRILAYTLAMTLGLVGGGLLEHAYMPVEAQTPVSHPVVVKPAAYGQPAIVGSNTIADLVQRVSPAVVNIDTIERGMVVDPFAQVFGNGTPEEYEEKGVGSGFFVDGNGLIITNNHVIRDAQNITVTTSDGKTYKGSVVGADPATDVALVQIHAHGTHPLALSNGNGLRVGDWVLAIGSPLGLSQTVSVGIISAMNREVSINERVNFIQTDAAINPGNSGGPLIDMQGQVVGMNTAIAARGQNIGFAIPAWTINNVVSQLRTRGHVEHPWLGISIRDLPDKNGVLVMGIVSSGPAASGGLRPRDRIVGIDGRPVHDARDLLSYLTDRSIGDTVKVDVLRDSQHLTLSIHLAPMPQGAMQPS